MVHQIESVRKLMKNVLLCCSFLLIIGWILCPNIASAQKNNVPVSGIIKNVAGELVVGASIVEKGTLNGTTSDVNGSFTIKVPIGAVLQISYVSFESQEIVVNDTKPINITLKDEMTTLQEFVVVGYGTQKKANLTGSVSTVTSKTIASRPVVSATQALQGTMPGLIIQQNSSEPGSGMAINIRGLGTLGNNNALILIDGVQGNLQNINPSDIESVTVLKDAASSAIYGSRAANGVILISTKSGSSSKARASYNFIYGIQQPTNLPKYADSWIYADLRNEALVNSGQAAKFTPEQIQDFKLNGPNDNWINDLYRKSAPQVNHNLTFDGGNDKTKFLLSLGYLNQESLFNGPDYGLKRYNGRLNVESKINNRLKVGGKFAFANNKIKEHAYWTSWIIEQATRMPPIYPITDTAGNYTLPSGSNGNSLARLEKGGERIYTNDEFTGNVDFEYTFTNELSLKGFIGGALSENQSHEFRKSIDYAPYVGGGDNESSVTESFVRSFLLNDYLTLNYNKKIQKHEIKGMLGASSESNKWNNFNVRRINVTGNDFGVLSNGQKTDELGTGGSGGSWALNSLFGRVNYTYSDKYLMEMNFRYDGSSRFASDHRYGFFPSVSLGWKISEENFMKPLKSVLSSMKIRGSWGQVGNQEIGLYQYLRTVSMNNNAYVFNNKQASGAYFSEANTVITWETSTMLDLGFDASVFENKFVFTFDYYNKLTDNILLNLPVPAIFGGGAPTQNAGSVRNQGYELSGTYNFATGPVKQSITFNLSDNINQVVDTKGQFWVNGSDITTIIKEGYPIGSYFAYKTDGFFQNQDEVDKGPKPTFASSVKPGDIRYVDKNGDNKIDEQDRFVLGNTFPRFPFGFNYKLDVKGFDFSLFIQGVGKRSVWIRGEAVEAFHNNNEGPLMDFHIDRWTPENPDATYPRLTVGSESTNNAAHSDFWIENAAYVRLKNIQFGYTLPAGISKKAGISQVRIYFSGQNLWTYTKLKAGYDPEVYDPNTAGSGRVYPVSKIYALGLDVTF